MMAMPKTAEPSVAPALAPKQTLPTPMKRLIAALMASLCLPSLAWAVPPKAPVQIEADQMLSSQKDNSVFFSGQVAAKQEDLTIHSDEMTVYYAVGPEKTAAKQPQAAKGQEAGGSVQSPLDGGSAQSPLAGGIDRLVAKGHVEITKEGWVATGDQAEYFSEERKVVLTGNTKVWQNNNLVTGETFIMYLDEGKTIVERNSSKKGERVKAFFYPEPEKR